jgi:hypothetical protein
MPHQQEESRGGEKDEQKGENSKKLKRRWGFIDHAREA